MRSRPISGVAYSDLGLSGGETITAAFTITITGERHGADVPELYLTDAAGALGAPKTQCRIHG